MFAVAGDFILWLVLFYCCFIVREWRSNGIILKIQYIDSSIKIL